VWRRVAKQLADGACPPEARRKPPKRTRPRCEMDHCEARRGGRTRPHAARSGRRSCGRLTRDEYNRTVRDFLGSGGDFRRGGCRRHAGRHRGEVVRTTRAPLNISDRSPDTKNYFAAADSSSRAVRVHHRREGRNRGEPAADSRSSRTGSEGTRFAELARRAYREASQRTKSKRLLSCRRGQEGRADRHRRASKPVSSMTGVAEFLLRIERDKPEGNENAYRVSERTRGRSRISCGRECRDAEGCRVQRKAV